MSWERDLKNNTMTVGLDYGQNVGKDLKILTQRQGTALKADKVF